MQKVLFVGMLLMLCVFAGGCWIFITPPVRDCPIVNLLLDENPFPPGAGAEEPLSPLPRAAMESAGRTIWLREGLANHDVYRYLSASRAAREFRHRKELQFSPREGGPWETPDVLTYRSPIANQYYVACGMYLGKYMCIMLAQYEEYYVFLNVHMSPDSMTYQDLERVLRAIDERMARCLGKPLPIEPVGTATP